MSCRKYIISYSNANESLKIRNEPKEILLRMFEDNEKKRKVNVGSKI
jgi:hypothetical protein